MMDRRAFIGALVILAAPRATDAQTVRKVHRIGILGLGRPPHLVGPQPQAPDINAFLQGLRERGYVYGEDFVTEARGSGGHSEEFPRLAAELIGLQVEVIVAAGPALPALKQATSTIPVVMTASGDPVGLGYAQSLGHPGGNFTGLSLQSSLLLRADEVIDS